MKITSRKATIIASLLLASACSFAQVPPAGTPPPPPPVGNVPPPPPPVGNVPPAPPPMQGGRPPKVGMPNDSLKALTTISGKLVDYTVNDRNVYDGFTLQTGGQNINVKFPAHLGETIMKATKKGSTISVNGFSEVNPLNVKEFHLVNATAGGTQITDTPPAPPTAPQAPEQKNYSGNISDFRKDPQGMINGIILDKNVVVDMPPPASNQLQSLLKVGQNVQVNGFKDVPPTGVVMASNSVVIHPQTISLNGQTYLVR